MIHKNYQRILEVKKIKMQIKVKKKNLSKMFKNYIKSSMNSIKTNKVKKIFLVKSLMIILSHFRTIIFKKILHKN